MRPTKTSAAGRRLIAAFEGLRLKAYDDGEGVLTIGYGHTSAAGYPSVRPELVITAARAEEILVNDLAPVERRVGSLIAVPLGQSEFDALVSFEFNTGDLARSSLPAKINAGRKAAAMDTLLQYVHGANTGRVYPGLVRRRKAERLMFEGKVAAALQLAGIAAAEAERLSRINASAKAQAPPPSTTPSPANVPPQPSALAVFLSTLLSFFRRKA